MATRSSSFSAVDENEPTQQSLPQGHEAEGCRQASQLTREGDSAHHPDPARVCSPGGGGAGSGSGWGGARKGYDKNNRSRPVPAAITNMASTDRLCQMIADRIEIKREGRGGKIALRAPTRREIGEGRLGQGEDGREEERDRGESDASFFGGGRRGSVDQMAALGGGLGAADAHGAGKVRQALAGSAYTLCAKRWQGSLCAGCEACSSSRRFSGVLQDLLRLILGRDERASGFRCPYE